MATATATRAAAPTEAEIRALIESAADGADFGELIHAIVTPLHFAPLVERGPAYNLYPRLWDDLRTTEAARLEEIAEPIYDLDKQLRSIVVEAAVQAALAFAAEYPDAPRAQPVQDAPGAAISRE